MSPSDAIAIVHTHQLWRRGKHEEMTNPTLLGEALDAVLDLAGKAAIIQSEPIPPQVGACRHTIKNCPDAHFAGIACGTCEDQGRVHVGQCRCGEVIHLDPGLAIGGHRFFYPGGFGRSADGWILTEVSCRGCGELIHRHWKPTNSPSPLG